MRFIDPQIQVLQQPHKDRLIIDKLTKQKRVKHKSFDLYKIRIEIKIETIQGKLN